MNTFATFLGEIARPVTIILLGFSASIAGIIIAIKVNDGNDGAVFMTAFGALVGGIYIGKAWEIVKTHGRRSGDQSEA